MSQLTIKLSDKADALIAQLQKEIFNRRRKKVSPAGVVETLLESGARSQSDKRFTTSWQNLISDIEKAARVTDAHGAKPANLTAEEWAMVLMHRTRALRPSPTPSKRVAAGRSVAKSAAKTEATVAPGKAARTSARKAIASKPAVRNPVRKRATRGETLKPSDAAGTKGLVAKT